MIIVGALGLLYSFFYLSGSMAQLGQAIDPDTPRSSTFEARDGYNDALLFDRIQSFNDIMMYCGIAMILLAVILYVTACNKRRNYYVSNYVATGLCVGGNIAMSIFLMITNSVWRGEFMNVDFESWAEYNDIVRATAGESDTIEIFYGDSPLWFDIGYAVYGIIIVASLILILNLVWKIMLMKGEKRLLKSSMLAGGETL